MFILNHFHLMISMASELILYHCSSSLYMMKNVSLQCIYLHSEVVTSVSNNEICETELCMGIFSPVSQLSVKSLVLPNTQQQQQPKSRREKKNEWLAVHCSSALTRAIDRVNNAENVADPKTKKKKVNQPSFQPN